MSNKFQNLILALAIEISYLNNFTYAVCSMVFVRELFMLLDFKNHLHMDGHYLTHLGGGTIDDLISPNV